MPNLLIEISAFNPDNGTTTPIRMASRRASFKGTYLDGYEWAPVIITGPIEDRNIWGDGQPLSHSVDYGKITFETNSDFKNLTWTAFDFENSTATMWVGNDGDDFTAYRQIWTGGLGPIERNNDQNAAFALKGPETDLARDLLDAKYSGGGGIEGPSNLTGNFKPYQIGLSTCIEPVCIDQARQIYHIDGYGACPIVGVFEGGVALVVGTNYATYDLLRDATVPAGQFATCTSQGCFKLSADPSGKLSADVGTAATIGDVIRALMLKAGLPGSRIDPSITTIAGAYDLYATDQTQLKDEIDKAALAAGGYISANANGRFYFSPHISTKAAGALNSDRSTRPLVLPDTIVQERVTPPAWSLRIGHTHVYNVHSPSEVSEALAIIADDVETAQKAADDAMLAAETAQADADAAITRLNGMANDGKITREEKTGLIRLVMSINAEQSYYVISGNAYNLTSDVATFTEQYNALNVYLTTTLSPAYDDLSGDTQINTNFFNAKFTNYYNARQQLANSIAAETAKRALWANVTGSGKPEDNATKSTVYYSPTAPTGNITANDIWVDTSTNPAVTKVRSGNAWVVSATIGATPGNLVVGATVNSVLDPAFADPTYWAGLTTATNGSGPGLLGVIRVARHTGDGSTAPAGGFALVTSTPAITVRGGERLQAGVSVAIGSVVNGSAYAQLLITSATGVVSYQVLPSATNVLNAVSNLTKNVTLPNDAVSVMLQLVTSFTGGQAKTGTVNFGKPFLINLTQIGSNLILGDGSTPTEGQIITSQGTALYLNGQGALATLNTVPASKLTFGSPDNMILDSEFTDTSTGNNSFWNVPTSSTIVTSGAAITAMAVRRGVTLTPADGTTNQALTASVSMTTASRLTCEPGAKYNIASRAYYPTGYNGLTRLNLQWRGADGAVLSNTTITGTSFTTTPASSAVVEDISAIVTAPDLAATVEFRYQSQWGPLASVGVATVGYPRIQRAITFGSNLITDSNGNQITDGMALNQWVTSPKVFQGFDASTVVPSDWQANSQATLSVVSNTAIGSNVLRITATSTDPNLIHNGPNMLGSIVPRIRVRARPIQAVPSGFPAFDGLLLWRTTGHDFSGTYSIRIKGSPVLNQWDYYEWDLSGQTDWMNSTITGVRFDLAASQQNWEVDWVQYLANVPAGTYIGGTLATQIESATSAATSGLATIANDNILDKGEKPRVIQEWQRVQGNYAQFITMAATYGVATTGITNAYNALDTYLNTTIGAGALNDLTSDTPIVGTTLRTRFGSYYVQESTLIGLVSTAAGTTAVWSGVSGAGRPMDGATVNTPGDHMVANANFSAPLDTTGKIPQWVVEGAYPGTVSRVTLATDYYAALFTGSASIRSVPVSVTAGETLYWRVEYRLIRGRNGTTAATDTAQIWAMIRYYDASGTEMFGLDSTVINNSPLSPFSALRNATGSVVVPAGARTAKAYFTMDIAPVPGTPSQAQAWCSNIDFDRVQWGATYGARSGGNFYAADGTTVLGDGSIITSQGTAQFFQNQGAWATYTGVSPTFMAARTNYLSNTTGRFTSGFAYNTGQMFGARAPVSATISASDRGSSLGAVINIPAHTRYYVGGSVNYNAGSINVAYSTQYFVYCDDPSTTGGSVTYIASTNALLMNANINRYYVGSIFTPSDGGGGTGGDNGGGGGYPCVAVDSFMGLGGFAGEVEAGDAIEVLDYKTMNGATLSDVTGVELAFVPCVRIVSESGIALVASIYTPITLRDGSMANIGDAVGCELPVRDADGFRWERIISLEGVGERTVAHIHAHGGTYAAGEAAGRFIYTHNPAKP